MKGLDTGLSTAGGTAQRVRLVSLQRVVRVGTVDATKLAGSYSYPSSDSGWPVFGFTRWPVAEFLVNVLSQRGFGVRCALTIRVMTARSVYHRYFYRLGSWPLSDQAAR